MFTNVGVEMNGTSVIGPVDHFRRKLQQQL